MNSVRSLWPSTAAARLLIVCSLLGTTAFFAVLPFGTLYLASQSSMTTAQVGMVIGAVSLVGAFGGILGGRLSDIVGPFRLLVGGLAATSAVFVGFILLQQVWAIATLFVLLGVCRAAVEPPLKHLLSTNSDDGRIFRLRYMTICLGAILGPAIGAVLYSIGTQYFFAAPAALYAAFCGLLLLRSSLYLNVEPKQKTNTQGGIRIALRDRRLLLAISAGTGIFFVFSQLETMLPLVMRATFGARTTTIFATLLIANAVLAIIFQPLVDNLAGKLSTSRLLVVGGGGFSLAFCCFSMMSHNVAWLYLGIVAWTVGEGILLPMPDMAVHDLATEQKGSYFGLAELRYLGFFVGPAAGGALLDLAPGSDMGMVYLVLMIAVITLSMPLLLLAKKPVSPVAESDRAERVNGVVMAHPSKAVMGDA